MYVWGGELKSHPKQNKTKQKKENNPPPKKKTQKTTTDEETGKENIVGEMGIEKYYEITGILETPDVDKYTGSLMYSSNNTPFILTSGRTFGIRSYIRF